MLVRIGVIAAIIAVLVGLSVITKNIKDNIMIPFARIVMFRMFKRQLFSQSDPKWSDGSLRVVACGTGTPFPDKSRASQCVYVVAGEEIFVFDTGDGSAQNLALFDLPMANISGIFFTHYHSDHIADFGEMVLNRWTRGAREPLNVYGPKGVERVVKGFQEAYSLDSVYRVAHHSETVLSKEGAKAIPNVIEVCGAEFEEREAAGKSCSLKERGGIALERNGVKVTAFLVHHEPARPAYGYRVDYNGRSVTISGDTVPCEEVRHYAKKSDILIHDAINHLVVAEMAKSFHAVGGETGKRFGKMMEDIQDYHSDPDSAIDLAADSDSHSVLKLAQVPPRRNAVIRRFAKVGWGTKRERNADWKGTWVEADDGMLWELPPSPSTEIYQRKLSS